MSNLAFVVVRFGAQITGGAEKLARDVAMRLAAPGHEITVLTTCADDYVTWANALPPGESRDGPLRILRFATRQERDLATWEAAMQPILRGQWSHDDEESVLREAGPDAPELLDHLRDHGAEYDAVIFVTLLYLPTVAGLPLVSDRAILVPTLHDEVSAKLFAHARAMHLARAVIWLTPEERELAQQLYDAREMPGVVGGVGIEPPDDVHQLRARERFGLQRPYLFYAGRIDRDKGCGEMIENFLALVEDDDRLDLVLCGRAWMEIPTHPRIRHLGVVDTADLWDITAGAVATVVPSRLESLSMLALEAMACGIPVLVPTGSPVLEGHVRRSAAGLVYADAAEFIAAARLLLDRPDTAAALGRDGRRYVAANFSWERIQALYGRVISDVASRVQRAG